jgi:heavy metal efflux system protein
VQGIVLVRRGAQTTPTIRRVDAEMDRINAFGILPDGVRLERIYDRSELVGLATEKVLTNLTFGVLLIFAVQWLFLGILHSAIVVAATIPFALLFAVTIMVLLGESTNLLCNPPTKAALTWIFGTQVRGELRICACGQAQPTAAS